MKKFRVRLSPGRILDKEQHQTLGRLYVDDPCKVCKKNVKRTEDAYNVELFESKPIDGFVCSHLCAEIFVAKYGK